MLDLQRSAGNRAVAGLIGGGPGSPVGKAALARAAAAPAAARSKGTELAPMTVDEMRSDVAFIVGKLKEQILTASEEREILERVQKWVDADRKGPSMGRSGSPHMDKFLFLLKTKAFTRSTARSGFFLSEATVNAYDTLWYELEDDRLETFKALVATSEKQKTSGPESGPSENLWATMGEQEAIGMMGMAKGLSTGLAGMMDVGAWAVTKGANAVLPKDMELAQPLKLADPGRCPLPRNRARCPT